jgi:trk system potassium uptake protein TrkA
VGKRVGDVKLPHDELLVCIVRNGTAVIPRPEEVIEQGDELIFYSQTLDIESVRELVAPS